MLRSGTGGRRSCRNLEQKCRFGIDSDHKNDSGAAKPKSCPESHVSGAGGSWPHEAGNSSDAARHLKYLPVNTFVVWKGNKWWAMRDSNSRHPRCKRGALPTELIALRVPRIMSAASVAVMYSDRKKTARAFVKFFCFFCREIFPSPRPGGKKPGTAGFLPETGP